MSSQVVIKEQKPAGYSRMATAIEQLAGKINTEPSGLYDQSVTVIAGDLTVTNDDLDIEFDIPFDDDAEVNEAEINIFNLTDSTISTVSDNAAVSISAGYGNDKGVIFSGYVRKKKTYWEDVDKITTIYALDNNGKKEQTVNLSFGAGTKASTILRKLAELIGLPIAEFAPRREHTYKDKVTVDGGLTESLRKYAQICGVSAYICKSKLYICNLASTYDVIYLSADTGLLNVTEFEETNTAEEYTDVVTGLNIEMLLNHRVQTGSVISITSKNANGEYWVREGSHTYDGDTFKTKVKAISLSCIK